jgi:hypothetical protein
MGRPDIELKHEMTIHFMTCIIEDNKCEQTAFCVLPVLDSAKVKMKNKLLIFQFYFEAVPGLHHPRLSIWNESTTSSLMD